VNNPFTTFATSTEAGKWLKEKHFTNTTILVKGSRSMQMEKVLE